MKIYGKYRAVLSPRTVRSFDDGLSFDVEFRAPSRKAALRRLERYLPGLRLCSISLIERAHAGIGVSAELLRDGAAVRRELFGDLLAGLLRAPQ